jgi:hypothetical protein
MSKEKLKQVERLVKEFERLEDDINQASDQKREVQEQLRQLGFIQCYYCFEFYPKEYLTEGSCEECFAIEK